MVLSRFDSDHDGRIGFEEYISNICEGAWTIPGHSVFAVDAAGHNDCSAALPEEGKKLFDEIVAKISGISLGDLEALRVMHAPASTVKELFEVRPNLTQTQTPGARHLPSEVLLTLLGQKYTDWHHAKMHLAHPKVPLYPVLSLPQKSSPAKGPPPKPEGASHGHPAWPRPL